MTRQLCESRIHPPIHTAGAEVPADLSTHWKTEDVSHEVHSQPRVKEQSSDIGRHTAALTLPSSSFADTAWLIVEVELVCCRALSTVLVNSRSGWPAEYVKIRSLMADVTLWRFPPRFGASRTVCPQLKSSNQLEVESGLETVLRNVAARWEAQEVRADLGMCMITVESAGD